MKTRTVVVTALISACLVTATAARADDAFLGALLGGGAGALVGHSMGGRDGAILGGALGAVAGAAIADQRRYRDNDVPQSGYYRQPAAVAAVPTYYVRDDRYWTWHREHEHEWEHRRWDRERGWEHRYRENGHEHHEGREDRGNHWDR